MDANFEKEFAVTQLKASALIQRTKSSLALAELLAEFVQLADIQQKQINWLRTKLRENEEKTAKLTGGSVPDTSSTDARRNSDSSDCINSAGAKTVRGPEVERNSSEVQGS
jgi:hypothetical protein